MTKVSYIMSEINKPPSSTGADGPFSVPDPPGASTKPYSPSGDGLKSFKDWLGPKGYKQFLATLSNFINAEMKRNQAAQDLAARRLGAAEKGDDVDDVTM